MDSKVVDNMSSDKLGLNPLVLKLSEPKTHWAALILLLKGQDFSLQGAGFQSSGGGALELEGKVSGGAWAPQSIPQGGPSLCGQAFAKAYKIQIYQINKNFD